MTRALGLVTVQFDGVLTVAPETKLTEITPSRDRNPFGTEMRTPAVRLSTFSGTDDAAAAGRSGRMRF